jgi:hypothetical protein
LISTFLLLDSLFEKFQTSPLGSDYFITSKGAGRSCVGYSFVTT